MKQSKRLLRSLRTLCSLGAAVFSSIGLAAAAQTPPARLTTSISNETRSVLAGSHPPRAVAANDLGALPATTAINGITLVFNHTAAQEAAVQALLVAQRNPASPQYRQWLTPEQYGAQFGVSDADLSTVESWLTSGGFTGMSVSRNRDRITFSGTAAQVNAAFGTELHQYRATATALNGTVTTSAKPDYAPSTDLSLPANLQPVVLAVQHLSTFRPRSQVRLGTAKPAYTSSETQNHYLTPPDLATMYDVSSVYNSGFNGAGQTIAIAGQTYIETTDVAHFQSAAGLAANLPSLFLVPNTGPSAIYAGDESESDLDVEYALGMARGANVILVYVGDSVNYGVFDALTYAITDNIAPIVSVSYGDCELDTSTTDINTYNNTTAEASLQGQTIITSAGDSGSTTCYGDTGLTTAQQETPSVDFIADLPNVTGIGGLQMQAGTFTTGNTTYFSAASGSDNISSLLSYVPETVWNEDVLLSDLSSGGGGTSTVIPRPTWQTGVTGIPAGSFRLVPDLALQASVESPGFLYCTSDTTAWGSTQTSSCTNGFRDSSTGVLTVAGGTSFGAPSFAGMLAVLNQAKNITRQGSINPTLYSLASNSATYASAFHDITTGNNECLYTYDCSVAGADEYVAGVGYDEASGLGSIDLAHLIAAWPDSTGSTLAATTTTVTAATLTPASGAADVLSITISSTTTGTPTGTVAISVDGGTATSVALTSGVASYTFPATTVGGSHVVTATYSGDGTYAPSIGTVTLTLAGTSIPTGSFTFTVPNVTAVANSTGSSTITLTPSGGYTGAVNFTISTALPSNTCYSITPIYSTIMPIPQYTLTIGNGAAVCSSSSFRKGPSSAGANLPPSGPSSRNPWNAGRTGTMLAGLLAVGFAARRRGRRLPTLMALTLLSLFVSLGLSGCGSSSTVAPTTGTTTTGSYTLTVVGTDSVTSTITSSASFTLTL